jgi:hypothetical protein
VEQKMKAQSSDDEDGAETPGSPDAKWRVCRVDIRSPLSRHPGHIARVELEHPDRGRLTDMGSALDVFGAIFAAVTHIFGCKVSVISLHSCHRTCRVDDDRDQAMAAIVVECDGHKRRGTASGQDVFYASLAAFIDAITNAEERDSSLIADGLNLSDDVDLLAARPCQTSGLDENGDWWLFASEDEGAAKAIAAEFENEGYEQVRISLPGSPLKPQARSPTMPPRV